MPHIVVEHTSNVAPISPPAEVSQLLHSKLASFESFNLKEIKSRWIQHNDYAVAEGNPSNGFVHVRVEILGGRPPELRKKVASALLQLVQKSFHGQKGTIDFSIEVREMDRDIYLKVSR